MYKIYTPQAWRSAFDNWPTLIIDDDGMIYRDADYYKAFRDPVGKIDYATGYIYGNDYHRVSCQPIGLIKEDGDVTKIYGEDYYRLNAWPILYIRGNSIYSDDEFRKLFPMEAGYIREESSGRAQTASSGSSFGSGGSTSYGGGSASSNGSGEREGGWFKTVVICLAVLVIAILMVKYVFVDEFGTAESYLAWASMGIGAILALIFAKDPFQSVKIVGISGGIFTWGYDLVCTYIEKGKIAGADFFVEVILAPFVLVLVYAIPAVIVGCLVSLIKGHFKGIRKEIKEYKAKKAKKLP